jgi:hypothetical protein
MLFASGRAGLLNLQLAFFNFQPALCRWLAHELSPNKQQIGNFGTPNLHPAGDFAG